MSRKRKYEAIQGYWVYTIKVPSINKFYVGVSKQQCSQRWKKSKYESMALEPYLDEWDSMIKTVLVDNLTKEEALKYEDNIIRALKMNDLCINTNRSGLIEVSDKNAYQRELYQTNTEYSERRKQRAKQRQKDNKEQKCEYDKQYYENNKEKIRERRRQRYLNKKLEKQQQTSVH